MRVEIQATYDPSELIGEALDDVADDCTVALDGGVATIFARVDATDMVTEALDNVDGLGGFWEVAAVQPAEVTITIPLDPTAAIEAAVGNVSLSGLGADGTSEYEVGETDVTLTDTSVTIGVEVERTEGKFAPKDEIRDAIAGELDEVAGLEVTG